MISNQIMDPKYKYVVEHSSHGLTKDIQKNTELPNVWNNNIIQRNISDIHSYSQLSSDRKMQNIEELHREYSDEEDDDEEDEEEEDEDENVLKIDETEPVNKIQDTNCDKIEVNIDVKKERVDNTPDHHARRPMNAFLIFCKRHRGIVKDKYPNLENRSITKILGEWWGSLEDSEEQERFKNLAKEYKDAFFSANPNFKWYKLPAPPLRTQTTRPTNERSLEPTEEFPEKSSRLKLSNTNYADYQVENNLMAKSDVVKKNGQQNVGFFKFADEAHMGGLSSLMISHDPKIDNNINHNNNNNNVGEEYSSDSSIEKTAYFSAQITSSRTEPFSNMKDHAAKMQLIKNKRKTSDLKRKSEFDNNFDKAKRKAIESKRSELEKRLTTNDVTAPAAFEDDKKFRPVVENYSIFDIEPDDGSKKSPRSCKGKRYQEFMSSTKQNPVIKKVKQKNNAIFPHNGYCKQNDYFDPNDVKSDLEQMKINSSLIAAESLLTPESPSKIFDASDFDLDVKIMSLNALDIDTYLTRKKEPKKKKKINNKNRAASATSQPQKQNQPQTIEEAREILKNSMVGSQKRKARKESITRRDISNNNNQPQENNIVNNVASENANSNLFILATLAVEDAKLNQ